MASQIGGQHAQSGCHNELRRSVRNPASPIHNLPNWQEHGRTNLITVQRIACAHDCGLIINPDGLRNQVESNILHTLSRTLYEEITFAGSRATSVDWATYPILKFPEVPVLEVALVDRPDQPSYGAGEAACTPVAALANAVFDATGVRLRQVPFTAARVKAALA